MSAAGEERCACQHPRGWHFDGEGSCIECMCLGYVVIGPLKSVQPLLERVLRGEGLELASPVFGPHGEGTDYR